MLTRTTSLLNVSFFVHLDYHIKKNKNSKDEKGRKYLSYPPPLFRKKTKCIQFEHLSVAWDQVCIQKQLFSNIYWQITGQKFTKYFS